MNIKPHLKAFNLVMPVIAAAVMALSSQVEWAQFFMLLAIWDILVVIMTKGVPHDHE